MQYFNSLKFIFFILFIFTLNLSAKDIKTIAFAQDTMANDFRKAQVHEVRDTLINNPNIKFIHSDAQGRVSLLIAQIEEFIDKKVDVLIIGTNDADAVVPVITKAYRQNIPVIILDRGINSDEYTAFINSDNIKIGEIAADYIAKRLNGKGSVLLFEGLIKADVTQLRSKGFFNIMDKYPDIKIIKRVGNYMRRDTIIEMEKVIKDGIHIDAVFAQSDSMISGVRSVLLLNNINPSSIITIGCDYTSEAQQAIKKGTQTGSVLFPLGGKESAKIALDIIDGKSVPKHISIPVKLVTEKNVEIVKPIF